jgi:hypothetical protein
MRIILFILFLSAGITAESQLPARGSLTNTPSTTNSHFYFNADLPVVQDKYPKFADGTPYFLEEWISGDIILASGQVYKNVKMRLDLVENSLQYISPDGVELVAASPVKSITIKDSANGKEYKFIYSSSIGGATTVEPGWYQVLVSGTATFYKRIFKTIVEPRNYSSSQTEPSVTTYSEYFLYSDWTLSRIKKIKEIPPLLKDKTDELDKQIAAKKLSGKSDKDYITLVEFYNSLLQPKAF